MKSIQNSSEMSEKLALRFNDVAGKVCDINHNPVYDEMEKLLMELPSNSPAYQHIVKMLDKYFEMSQVKHELCQMAFEMHDQLVNQ